MTGAKSTARGWVLSIYLSIEYGVTLDRAKGNRDVENSMARQSSMTLPGWSEGSRYRGSSLNGKDLHNAVAEPDGALPWVRQRW